MLALWLISQMSSAILSSMHLHKHHLYRYVNINLYQHFLSIIYLAIKAFPLNSESLYMTVKRITYFAKNIYIKDIFFTRNICLLAIMEELIALLMKK